MSDVTLPEMGREGGIEKLDTRESRSCRYATANRESSDKEGRLRGAGCGCTVQVSSLPNEQISSRPLPPPLLPRQFYIQGDGISISSTIAIVVSWRCSRQKW